MRSPSTVSKWYMRMEHLLSMVKSSSGALIDEALRVILMNRPSGV